MNKQAEDFFIHLNGRFLRKHLVSGAKSIEFH